MMTRRYRRPAPSAIEHQDNAMPTPADQFRPPARLSQLCLDVGKPPEVRAKILSDVLQHSAPPVQLAALTDLLRQSTAAAPAAEAARLKECYQQALAELEHGPVRPATYLGPAPGDWPGPQPRVHVVTPDGQERCPMLHPRVKPAELRPGMTAYLDPKGSVVLGASADPPPVGQEGTFLRLVDGTQLVEATLQNDRLLLYAAAPVLDALAAGQVKNGDRLVVCPRRRVAFAVVPPESDYRHRFLDDDRLPEVVAERDIGSPHWVLDYLRRRLRLLLFRPDLLQDFDLRPRVSVLLTGPSGCGKTLTIRAFLHDFKQLLAERTGRRDLGSRVVRVKVSELLSEWLGRSDKNIEELFADILAVAGAEVETASGQRLRLPVVVILEEVEGLARRRGGQEAAVYDRILTTLLQRLDDPADEMGRLPVLLLSTTNRPDLIDSAMARRLGVQARFSRLDREGLAAVLGKKMKPHFPYQPVAGLTAREVRAALIEQVVGTLFGPGAGRDGAVEVTLKGGRRLVKYRRDLLTGALVDQAVADAVEQTVLAAEEAGAAGAGLTAEAVAEALGRQIDTLADSLTAANAADYLDLPGNAQVAGVRRLPGGGVLPPLLSDLEN
jgi:ATP-dependent 26S proteasome regulatory subunit